MFRFRPLTQADAEAIAGWSYPGEYAFYDWSADADDERELLTPALRADAYAAVDDEAGELVGFFSFKQPQPGTVERGLGLRPDHTGRGLLRVREFIMKDGYSFDRDSAGLDESFRKHSEAYKRIFERCGLETYEVEAESGIMGGSGSKDFLAPSGSGENTLVTCENGDYAADLEIAEGRPPEPDFPDVLPEPKEVETPGQRTIEAVSQFLGVDPRATAKAMPVVADGNVVLALVRGDDRLNEMKLLEALGEDFRPAEPDEIRQAFGASGGSIGPVGVSVDVIADEALREGQYVVGANRDDVPLRGVQASRDYEPRFADLREIREGDACP